MLKAIYTAADGMLARIRQQEVTANNLANINTTGFKKDNIFLHSLQEKSRSLDMEAGIDYTQSALKQTNNTFDLALSGDGFFAVQTVQGIGYTRNGNFCLDSEGQLVTYSGYPVLGEMGNIEIGIGAKEILIGKNGDIFVDGTLVNRLLITDFEKPYKLKKLGHSIFISEDQENRSIPIQNVEVKQGFLEQSNVNPILEMVKMIEILRNFDSSIVSIHSNLA